MHYYGHLNSGHIKKSDIVVLDDIRMAFQLRRLERSRDRIRAVYAKDILEARAQKKHWKAIELIEESERWEVELVQDEIEHLHSKTIVKQANRFRVPLPADGWERSRQLGVRYLTDEGYANLRRALREEKRERWDSRIRWMPPLAALITAIGGVLGMLIGLISILKP